MKHTIIFLIIMSFSFCFAAEDKNSEMRMEGNRGLVTYDLIGEPNEDAEVNFSIEYNGKKYTQDELSVSGDIGKVISGCNKKIYWDVLKDFPKGLVGNIDWFLDVGGKEYKDPITGMEFVFVKGGCYQMGSKHFSNTKPVHKVCVDDFYMGKYEVTQGEWQKVMGRNSSRFTSCGSDCPVEKVSWNDAQNFIRKLNSRSRVIFKLPTEAEWEYAAKGGTNYIFSGSANIDEVAWAFENSGDKTHPVGKKKANGFGLYDMSGNVREWVEDVYSDSAYSSHQSNNPVYKGEGSNRVSRGGDWLITTEYGHLAFRYQGPPDYGSKGLGFRLSRTVK